MSEWQDMGPVQAGASSIDIHRQSAFIFRVLADGQVTAPGWPTHMRSGTLMRRPAAAFILGGTGVRRSPMSETRL